MRQYLTIAALAVGILGPWTITLVAEESPIIELAAPRPAGPGESVQIQITTGPLPRGARLALLTENGEILGAMAPYPPGRLSNMATVPVPRSAIVDGRAGYATSPASTRRGSTPRPCRSASERVMTCLNSKDTHRAEFFF